MTKLVLISLLLFANYSFGQHCNCDSTFVETQKIVEDNYAGWFDKVKLENRKAYSEWTATKFSEAKAIQTDSACAKKLQEWISYFKDKHLRIKYSKQKSADTSPKTESKELKILTTSITENKAYTYFKETKKLDPIEGLYIHPSYRLAITKVKPDLFYATVLTTKNENWKVGDVKLIITKTNDVYSGIFYNGNKSDYSNHSIKLVDNILDFDIALFEKIAPKVKVKKDIAEYEISKDRYAPSIKFENDVVIWKFPCFYSNSAEQTTFLLNKYKDKLTNIPYWIIDLRDNDGGDYQVGMQLMKYIYSKPIVKYNSEMRMTNQNIDLWFNSFVKEAYDQLDTETKKVWDSEIEMMRSKVGSMYNRSEKATDTLQIENTIVNPKKIALLTNENTVSSGELFTVLARQSEKAIVMGSNTAGMMDYGNIVHYKTNCTTIKVQLPIDRMLWLDTGFSVDKEGIKPDVYLEGNSWTEQATKIIKK